MNDEFNFAGYIQHNDTQFFCTVNNYVVKMLYKSEPISFGKDKTEDEEKYLFGFTENDCLFAVLMPQGTRFNGFSSHVPFHFSSPLFIKAKSTAVNDLSYFDAIEFYGETVNKTFNPRQAVNHSKSSSKIEDINLGFKKMSDYSKEYEVEIDGEKTKIEYVIYRYVHLAEQRNEDGSISLGSLNSAVRIKFENQKPLESIKRYWVAFNNLLVFLTGRHNVDFGVRLFQKNESNLLSHTADSFFRRIKSEIYNEKIYKTIQLNSIGEKSSEFFKLFFDENASPYLRFLPENNKMANLITDADVLNICTAFEIEFGRDKSADKEIIVNEMKVPEFKNSVFSRRILYLYQKATYTVSGRELQKITKSIADFVILRDNITHNGKLEWGDCGKFSRTLLKILYVNILLRAGMDKDTAINIAEIKWEN